MSNYALLKPTDDLEFVNICGNKLCFQREHERNIQMHEDKIRSMKKMIDNVSPQQYDFLTSRKKKEAMQTERNNKIQHENTVLINKLTGIVNRSNSINNPSLSNAGSTHHSRLTASSSTSSMLSTLNQPFRKKQFVKIVLENQAMLKRIQTSKSEYNVKQWQDQRTKNEKYIASISEYPYKDFKPNKTMFKMGVWHETNASDYQQQQHSQFGQKKPRQLEPLQHRGQKNSQGHHQSTTAHVIFKNQRRIGTFTYLVEIKIRKGLFIVSLENLERVSNHYGIELSEEEGLHILREECEGDVERIIDRILIDDKTKSFHFKRNPYYSKPNAGGYGNYGQSSHDNSKAVEERDEEEEASILNIQQSPSTKQQSHSPQKQHPQDTDSLQEKKDSEELHHYHIQQESQQHEQDQVGESGVHQQSPQQQKEQ